MSSIVNKLSLNLTPYCLNALLHSAKTHRDNISLAWIFVCRILLILWESRSVMNGGAKRLQGEQPVVGGVQSRRLYITRRNPSSEQETNSSSITWKEMGRSDLCAVNRSSCTPPMRIQSPLPFFCGNAKELPARKQSSLLPELQYEYTEQASLGRGAVMKKVLGNRWNTFVSLNNNQLNTSYVIALTRQFRIINNENFKFQNTFRPHLTVIHKVSWKFWLIYSTSNRLTFFKFCKSKFSLLINRHTKMC